MNIEKAIQKAIEGGWKNLDKEFPDFRKAVIRDIINSGNQHELFRDPKFWQSLGKALKWKTETVCWSCEQPRKSRYDTSCCEDGGTTGYDYLEGWEYQAIRYFRDYAMQGKTAELFFKELI